MSWNTCGISCISTSVWDKKVNRANTSGGQDTDAQNMAQGCIRRQNDRRCPEEEIQRLCDGGAFLSGVTSSSTVYEIRPTSQVLRARFSLKILKANLNLQI